MIEIRDRRVVLGTFYIRRILAEYNSAIVRPRGRFISRVEVLAGVCHDSEAEGNCVIVRWGGEQPEVNWQSVG